MLTLDQIHAMSDAQAQAHFAACCAQLYGSQWQKPFAREADFAPETGSRWMMAHKRPPVWAIRLADSLHHAREIQHSLTSFGAALDRIKALQQAL